MAYASRLCGICGHETISMSSSQLANKRMERHVNMSHRFHQDVDMMWTRNDRIQARSRKPGRF